MAPSPTPLLGEVGGLVMAAYHCDANHGAKDLLHRVVATTLEFYPPLQRLLANHPTYSLLRFNAALALKFTPPGMEHELWYETLGLGGGWVWELCHDHGTRGLVLNIGFRREVGLGALP